MSAGNLDASSLLLEWTVCYDSLDVPRELRQCRTVLIACMQSQGFPCCG